MSEHVSGVEERIAAILAEHEGCVPNADLDNPGSGMTALDAWSCGIRLPYVGDLDDMNRAHTASAIAAVVAPDAEQAARDRAVVERVEATLHDAVWADFGAPPNEHVVLGVPIADLRDALDGPAT